MSSEIKVELDERAVLARVNRALKKTGQHLKKCNASSAAFRQLGTFYLIATEPAVRIERTHVDLSDLANELGLLAEYEQVATTTLQGGAA